VRSLPVCGKYVQGRDGRQRSDRGCQEAASLLGEDYPGTVGSDGWASCRIFEKALRQARLGHLLRRCKEMLETAKGRAVRFPYAAKEILKQAFVIRDARAERVNESETDSIRI
jgi:hypothetical protein